MTQQILLLAAAFGLVLLNGFFVAAEFALVKVRATKITELADQGHWRARVAKSVISRLDAYLSATQLGITFASLGLGWIGEPAVARLIEPIFHWIGVTSAVFIESAAFALAFAVISFLHIVLGELAPKSLAIRKPETTSLWTAMPLRAFYIVMYPAIIVLNGAANWVLKMFGLSAAEAGEMAHSPEELRMIVTSSHAHGSLNAIERLLLENVIDFSERKVAEIMTPRIDMVCLNTRKSLGENIAIVREHQHTRFPLADGNVDRIIGIIHVKDLFLMQGIPKGDGGVLRSIMRPALYVPETATIDILLKEIQRRRTLMSIVVDEFGAVAGVVTLEDILEEIVGPIQDEFDVVEEQEIRQQGSDLLIDGGMPLAEVSHVLEGIDVPSVDEVRTLGGYVMKQLGHVPKVGESLNIGPYQVQVIGMEHFRITKLRFRKTGPSVARK